MDSKANTVERVIAQHRALRVPTEVSCIGHRFWAIPGVFSPLIAPSGFLELSFAAWPVFEGRSVLDVGSGSGISTCLFALAGARKVMGADINPAAAEAGARNAKEAGVMDRVGFVIGDVLEPVGSPDEFDIVFANLPFMSGEPRDMLERAFYDPGLGAIRRFIAGAGAILRRSPSTKVYLCTSNLDAHDLPAHAGRHGLRWEEALTIDRGWVRMALVELLVGGTGG